jgi:hypothetical protein
LNGPRDRPPVDNRDQRGPGDNRPPPARDDFRDRPPADREDFSDRDDEAQRLARDDSFRTPHSDNDPDDAGDSGNLEPVDRDERDDSRGEDLRDDDTPNRDTDFERVPARDDDYAAGGESAPRRPRSPGPPARSSQGRQNQGGYGPASPNAPARSSDGPPPQQGNQGGYGPRRHRGYGRRPPPGGGDPRGPDHD